MKFLVRSKEIFKEILGYLIVHEVEKNSYVLNMSVRRCRRKLWLGLWIEIFNEYKSIMLIKILTLIKK